jgi:hypothetical protein
MIVYLNKIIYKITFFYENSLFIMEYKSHLSNYD